MTIDVRAFLATALTVLTLPLFAGGQSPAEAIFREGLMMERAEGRLRDAIFRYERVVAEFPGERAVVAQALHQLALAYEKVGDPRAKVMWARLASAPANPFVAEARKKVAAVQATGGDGPFPMRSLDPSYELGSPDGRWVVYHKGQDQRGRLYLRDLMADSERVLLDVDGIVSNLAWSPDSRELAFNYDNITNGQRTNDIRIVSIASRAARSIGVPLGFPTAWTTRGELLFYRPNYPESATDLWLVPVAGGEPRKVYSENMKDSCGWAISPDGGSLVACRSKRLVLRDLTSGAEQAITTGSGTEGGPGLSADGRLVSFGSNDEGKWALYVAPLDRLPVQRSLRIAAVNDNANPGAAWWTQDGLLTMRLTQAEDNVYRIDMDAQTGRAIDSPRRLTQDAPSNTRPSVNTNGARIAYFAAGVKRGIAVMDANGLNERPLLEQGGRLPLFWRSPEEILFHNFDAAATAAGKASIAALNIETGAITEVARIEGLYWWFVPARREILHVYPRGGGYVPGAVLKAFSLADGRDRVVAKIDFLSPRLAVSPDGRHIAYTVAPGGVSTLTTKGCELALMTIDGQPEKVLVPLSRACPEARAWSPNGKYLLVDWRDGPRVINVQTGESWALHPDTQGQEWTDGSWAPDGSYVTLTRSTRRLERLAWEGVTTEAVMRLLGR